MISTNGELAKLIPEPKYKLNTVGFFGSAGAGGGGYFEDDMSSDNWTYVGTGNIAVSGGSLNINGVGGSDSGGEEDRAYQSLGLTLSDVSWVAEWKLFGLSTTGAGSWTCWDLVFSAGNLNPYNLLSTGTNQDFISTEWAAAAAFPLPTRHGYKDGTGALTRVGSPHISLSSSTDYWKTLTRLSATSVKHQVFSNVAKTTELTNSPKTQTIPSTVTGLTHIQAGHLTNAMQVNGRTSTYKIDDIVIYDGVTTPP